MIDDQLHIECKIFLEFFIESFLVLITIQLVSDKINNNDIDLIREIKISLLIALIAYIARMINSDLNQNIRQGLAYGISSVFLAKYNF